MRSTALMAIFATLIGTTTGVAAAQPSTPLLVVANNVSDDISTFRIGSDGTLDFVGRFPSSEGPISIGLSPDGRYLAVGHGTMNDVIEALNVFAVNSDGSLRLAFEGTTPDSPLDLMWLSDATLAVTRTSSSGLNTVEIYKWDDSTETLSSSDSEQTGSFSSDLAATPGGEFLFAFDSFGNQIFRFSVNANSTIDLLGVTSTGSLFGLGPGVTPDGAGLYAGGGISGGGNAILGFAIDNAGDLSPLPGQPFTSPGASPKVVQISDDGRILFAGHGTDSTAHSFILEEDGSVTPADVFDVGLQGTLGDIATWDEYLFITDESLAIDDTRGVYSFKFDGAGQLTQVDFQDPGGVRPEMMDVFAPLAKACAEDLDGDGAVGSADLGILLGDWGMSGGPADFDGGGVGSGDLAILLGAWGPCT